VPPRKDTLTWRRGIGINRAGCFVALAMTAFFRQKNCKDENSRNCKTEKRTSFSSTQRVIARRNDEAICYLTHNSLHPFSQFYLCKKTYSVILALEKNMEKRHWKKNNRLLRRTSSQRHINLADWHWKKNNRLLRCTRNDSIFETGKL
jgi:hypothetical protein